MTKQANFKENFKILEENAVALQQGDVEIDELISIVEQSMQAYKNCSERLQAIELALSEAFNKQEQEPA